MKIKKGDTVLVIAGKSRGKKGTVTRAMPQEGRVVIEGVNMQKKHQKPRGSQKGAIVERPSPVHISNVMLVDPKSGGRTRIGITRKNGVRIRIAKKSGTEI